MTPEQITPETCIVRNTAARKGRTRAIEPGPTASRHLHYGRIILDAGGPIMRFATGELETGLLCLGGEAVVTAAGHTHTLTRSTLYVPRDADVTISAASGCDIAEIAAPVSASSSVRLEPRLRPTVGSNRRRGRAPYSERADRQEPPADGKYTSSVTFSQPGNWTSWPPHEHAAMLEEAYLYIEMPPPGFGVQLVYANAREPELATIVREGDVVLMPQGYHPNVGAPGSAINFVWMMAANREDVDRQYGVVNVQPDFAALGSGLDAARTATR
jgi:5-deoxy-glucuronate isomerase